MMRNRKIIKAAKEDYRRVTSGLAPPPVTCVSNLWYSMHIEGYDEYNIPCSMDATGIPALRRECLVLPALGQLNTLKHHLRSTLPGLLNTIDAWSNSSKLRRQKQARRMVEEPLKVCTQLHRGISAYFF